MDIEERLRKEAYIFTLKGKHLLVEDALKICQEAVEEAKGVCEWKREKSYGYWETGCGETFQFTNDGLKENHFNYCHNCGKKIKDVTNKE